MEEPDVSWDKHDLKRLYGNVFTQAVMNHYHAALMRCVCVMTMTNGERLDGRKVRFYEPTINSYTLA